jgi:predicted Zn finger-like uncharacterized protein
MITVCPSCRQQLAVTAADLRVGQGFVRCGRCDKVFNALLTLAEDMPPPTDSEAVAHGTGSMPALDEQDLLPPLPGHEDDIPFGPMDEEVEVVQTHMTGQYRSLVLEGDQASPDDEEEMPGAQDEQQELARDIIRQATSQPIDILLGEDPPPRPAAAPPPPRPPPPPQRAVPPEPEPYFDADEAIGNEPRPRRLWYVAAALLALLLLGQYVHHNRQQLVTKSWLERPIQLVYGLFGRTVEPPWDVTLYEVAALGERSLSNDGRTLKVPAAVSVSKDARWSQPPPVVRVILSDRWGNVLATHALSPRDWLLGDAPGRMEPGQRLDAELSMPTLQRATNFELDPCLHDNSGALRCKDDPPP